MTSKSMHTHTRTRIDKQTCNGTHNASWQRHYGCPCTARAQCTRSWSVSRWNSASASHAAKRQRCSGKLRAKVSIGRRLRPRPRLRTDVDAFCSYIEVECKIFVVTKSQIGLLWNYDRLLDFIRNGVKQCFRSDELNYCTLTHNLTQIVAQTMSGCYWRRSFSTSRAH